MLYPAVAMFFLTFTVWLVMYVQRFRYMAAHKIKPQLIATPGAVATLLPEWVNRPSDNLRNLFEMPVVFYAACGLALIIQPGDRLLILMAWGFVIFRIAHSAIHCTINHVPSRFAAYLASSLILFGIVIRLALLAS